MLAFLSRLFTGNSQSPPRLRGGVRLLAVLAATLSTCVLPTARLRAQTCSTQQCTETLTPTIYLNNNMWGNPSGQFGTGSVTVNSSTSWSTSWNFTDTNYYNVITYANANLGWFYGYKDTGTGLPFMLATNTPVNSTTAFNVTGTWQGDVAYDAWCDKTQNPTGNPDNEIMIWEKCGGVGPSLAIVGNPTIDGVSWDVYQGNVGWQYTAFLLHGGGNSYDLHGLTINFMDFMNWMISQNMIQGTEYLLSVPFGTEVDTTPAFPTVNGTLNLTNYTCVVGTAPPPTIPAPPANMQAVGNNGSISLGWNQSMGATSYSVKRSTVSGSGYASLATGLTTNSYLDSGLTNGITYYYVATATNSAGTSGNSSQASAAGAPDVIQYDFETGTMSWATFGGTASVAQSSAQHYTGANSLAATVTNSGGGLFNIYGPNPTVTPGKVITYHVYIPAGSSQLVSVQPYFEDFNFTWTGNWVPIANLTQGAWNTIQVTVPISAVMPAQQVGVEVQTNATTPLTFYIDSISWAAGTVTTPPAPTGLAATAGNTQVSLTWNASSGATSYNVLRSTVSGSGYASAATGVSTTSYTNTGLTNGTTYYFVVTATNSAGTSGNSNQASATPTTGVPAAPTGLTATPGNAQAALSWTASSGATSYNALRSTVSGSGYASVATGIATTSYTNTGLTNGTTYYFVVTATNANGTSGNSNQASATPTASGDTAQYNFESSVQGWAITSAPATACAQSTTQVYAGANSLAITMNGASGCGQVTVNNPGVAAGQVITFHVWIPSGMPITQVQPNVTDNNGAWDGTGVVVTAGSWNTVTLTVPANAAMPIKTLSMEYCTSATWSGTVYLDSVSWPTSGAPSPPTGLTATAGNAQVALSWTASTGATSYNVKRSTVNGSGYVTVSSPTTTSYTNTGLTNGTTYYYVVTAVNASGESGNSSQVSATPQVAAPPAPTGLAATPGNAQVALTWNASTGATAYDVKRSTVSGSGYVTVSSPTVTNYTNTGLTNGTTYYFVVDAKNAGGTSANSSQVSATPTSGIPPVPTGLAATPGNAQVALTWNASTGATAYDVKRSTVSGSGYVTVSSPTVTNYTNTGLTNGTTYYFVVDAKNASGTSANSAQVSATPQVAAPAAPTGLTATPGNTQVALSWTASSGATAYDVKRSTVSGSGYATVSSPTVTSYTNTGLTNGTTYYFVVDAKNAGGTSANSSQVSAVPTASGDTSQYNFESGVQGWIVNAAPATAVAQSSAQHFLGSDSLAITMNGASGCGDVSVASPGVTAGKVITYHVWIPSGMPITQVQPYVTDSGGHWDGTGAVATAGAWTTVTLTVPANAVMPITKLGIQYCTSATWSGTVYLDSISW